MTFALLTAQGNSCRLLAQAPLISSRLQGMLRDTVLVALGGLMVAVVGVVAHNKRSRAPQPFPQGILLQPENMGVYWTAPDNFPTGPEVLVPMSPEVQKTFTTPVMCVTGQSSLSIWTLAGFFLAMTAPTTVVLQVLEYLSVTCHGSICLPRREKAPRQRSFVWMTWAHTVECIFVSQTSVAQPCILQCQ